MKKSLLALVVLGAFASAASAQSSVTIYGKLDQGFGKNIGSADRSVREAGNSRLGFRGNEDLGGGLNAIFSFEHRFSPDDGIANNIFWHGHSYVGLSHNALGAFTIGRQYTSAFMVQDAVDPFNADGVAALRGIGMITAITNASGSTTGSTSAAGGVAVPGQIRIANSAKYRNSFAGFTVAADIGEHVNGAPGDDKPFSVAATYGAGPVWVGLSYEDASGPNNRLINAGAKYTFSVVTLSAGIADGRTDTDQKLRGYLVGANVAVGAGDIKLGWASQKVADVNRSSRFGLGYHHNLSKRTKLYTNVAREQKILANQKNGYELGLQHNF